MATADNAVQHLTLNKFKPHSNGNAMMFGLNSFGCHSIIRTDHDQVLWMFIHFNISKQSLPMYINMARDVRGFDFNNPDIVKNTTRMEES